MTIAAKPKRRPPFTTLATRLMPTSFSTKSPSSRSPRWRSPSRPRWPRSRPPEDRAPADGRSPPPGRGPPPGRAPPPPGRAPLPPPGRALPPGVRAPKGLSLESEPALAGGVGQGLDPAMEEIAAAVEHDGGDAGGLGALGDEPADGCRSGLVGALLEALAQGLVAARPRGHRSAGGVVHHLRVDVLRRAEHRQPQPAAAVLGDPPAHAPLPPPQTILWFASHPSAP